MPVSNKEYLQINQALFSLTHAYESRMVHESGNDSGLSLSDCSVLMVLCQCAPTTAAHLSEIMDINPGTISVYVQRLVVKGLVKREQDVDDRRNWWLSLTDAGLPIAKSVVDSAITYTRDFLSALDGEEQQTLQRILLKVSHSLGFDWQ
jgi:MarR family transcriptional regulator, organic hydroperoxide resistance regulator